MTFSEPCPLPVQHDHLCMISAVLFARDQQADAGHLSLECGGTCSRILVVEEVGGGAVAADKELLVGKSQPAPARRGG